MRCSKRVVIRHLQIFTKGVQIEFSKIHKLTHFTRFESEYEKILPSGTHTASPLAHETDLCCVYRNKIHRTHL